MALVDSFGRVHRDLRISVTDRCNFRCSYCMPEEGLTWLPREQVLTYEEITRLARLFVDELGITSIRITGGEPTVRAHLPVLIAKLAALGVDLALTTNGASLTAQADDLVSAGLRRVNVSIDTLRHDRFVAITRRDELDRVLAGIEAAVTAGLDPVKLNMVVMRGVNDDEVADMAAFGRSVGGQVRFIEYMPLDADGAWELADVVGRDEILDRVEARFPLERGSAAAAIGREPAELVPYADGRGAVGVIASVTDAFCDACDRVRLTAEGQLRSCLFALDEVDLRGPLREGASDDELIGLVRGAVARKWAGHRIAQPVFVRPARSMSQIGG